jgi:hypothetical protein
MSHPSARTRSRFFRLWGWPLGLGVLTTTGLLSALVSDQGGDTWSWFALGVPTAVMAHCAWRKT